MNRDVKILSISDLSIGYSGSEHSEVLLNRVSISAARGEMIAVVGANGTGKSTLLRSIIGLHKLHNGLISLNGQDIKQYSPAGLSRLFGFVGTSNQTSNNLTLSELVSLGRFPFTNWIGRMKSEDWDAVDKAIRSVSLDKFRKIKIGEMSDGEKQRANIARVLAQDSKIIVLDEPTAFLDLPNRYELIYLLKDIIDNEDKTVIYSTHDLNIAISESDKIWMLLNKEIIEGAPEDLILGGDFSRQFSSSKIEFNMPSASFIYPSESLAELGLIADKKYFEVTRKALKRARINVVSATDHGSYIKVIDENESTVWILQTKNDSTRFQSLYDLVAGLRSTLISGTASGD